MRRDLTLGLVLMTAVCAVGLNTTGGGTADARLNHAHRFPPVNGWTQVHLEGTPGQIGYQHGSLLADEIEDVQKVVALELQHDNSRPWSFFRDEARDVLWPHIEAEYRAELQGIADGVRAGGSSLDVWDIVAMNAFMEWSYFVEQYDKQHHIQSSGTGAAADRCSAFVATGSYTKDGRIVMAHNNWTNYLDGARWTIVFDIVPTRGRRVIMDGLPGLIHSGDDFGVNSAGIVITETTISQFHGYDMNGVPEFVRARKAMQYAESIDDAARIFKDGNNGGYANDWLIADMRKNEIASLELGLKNVTLERKTDGYFVGSNFPINPKLLAEETTFAANDMGSSANARHVRWEQLMKKNKGRIDVAMAEAFLADHVDSFTGTTAPSERTLCGHVEASERGVTDWQPPYGTAGAAQNKVTDAAMAARMSFMAAAGHACGTDFIAAQHLKAHPTLAWEAPQLRDMKAFGWTELKAR